jgi:hypothetical protein
MKKTILSIANTARTLGAVIMIGLVSVTYTGCKQEGCTDVDANNYSEDADEDDGTCTYDYEKFIGTFSTTSPCVTGASWNTSVATSSTSKKKVVVSNIGGLGSSASVVADVNGSTIQIPSQTAIDSDGDSWTISSTSGTLSGNSINITVTYTFGTSNLTCSETWNKQ